MNWQPQNNINRDSFPGKLDCVIPARYYAKKSGEKMKIGYGAG
jgi:hypothetical protein